MNHSIPDFPSISSNDILIRPEISDTSSPMNVSSAMIDARKMPKLVLSETDTTFSTGGIIAGFYMNAIGNPHGKISLLVNTAPERLEQGIDNYRTEVHSGGFVVENRMKKIYSARPNLAIENNDAFAPSLTGNILSSTIFLSGTTHFGEIIPQ